MNREKGALDVRTDTLRHALDDLRAHLAVAEGQPGYDTGGARQTVALDDGDTLTVDLAPASGGGVLMGVYQITRRGPDGSVRRRYPA